MPHLRPLGDLVDPRLGVAGRRSARRRFVRFVRSRIGVGTAAEQRQGWHERVGRNAVDVPDNWRTVHAPARPAEWAIVVHDVDGGGVSQAIEDLTSAQVPAFDLFVLSADAGVADRLEAPPQVGNVRVLPPQPEGSDWDLCALVNSGLLDPYRVVLRRSTRPDPPRREPSPAVDDLQRAFAADAALGVVSTDGPLVANPRRARPGVRRLLRRLELGAPRTAWTYPSGQDYWIRGFLVHGLRALNLSHADFAPRRPRRHGVDATTFAQTLGALAKEAGCTVVQDRDVPVRADESDGTHSRARVVALYLPQFHPIKENDEWWGPGFTEWTNVTAARPVYPGHFQPKLPLDLGFYDLRLDDIRRAQARLAADHGVAGFMYYHYWFAGRPLLERPINALLNSDLEFPFCIMWANENWTRAWDGGESEILMAQDYDAVPAADFIDDVLPFLQDSRYLRVDDRALVAVYRPGQIPDFPDVVSEWRRRAAEHGVSLFVVSVDVPKAFDGLEGPPESYGLDGHMGFPPHRRLHASTTLPWVRPERRFHGLTYDYAAMVRADEQALRGGLEASAFPGVMVGFDNTARRPWNSVIWVGANPYTFRRWLGAAVEAVSDRPYDQRVVFVNAWNEWAEGAILEPTTRFGHTFLQAVRDVTGAGCSRMSLAPAGDGDVRPGTGRQGGVRR